MALKTTSYNNFFKSSMLAITLITTGFNSLYTKEDSPVKKEEKKLSDVKYFKMNDIIASAESPLEEVKELQDNARRELEGQMKVLQEEAMTLRKEEEEFKRNHEMLNDEERRTKEAEIMQKQMASAQKAQEFQRNIEIKTAQISQKAMELISQTIEKLTNGKNAICDVVVPLPYKCNPKFDITNEIVNNINKEYRNKKEAEKKSKEKATPAS